MTLSWHNNSGDADLRPVSPTAHCRSSLSSRHPRTLLSYYIVFGALHELSHIACASILHIIYGSTSFNEFLRDFVADGLLAVLFRTILARQCVLPPLGLGNDDRVVAWAESMIRHSGWIFSVVLAVLVCSIAKLRMRQQKTADSISTVTQPIVIGAIITAVEALWTDLFCLSTVPLFGPTTLQSAGATYLCGNFGVIAINTVWTSADNGQHTLDLLQRMITVTMMRGAQSGGVITYCKSKRFPNKNNPTVGVRSRVVNKKRTDLSKLIRVSPVHLCKSVQMNGS